MTLLLNRLSTIICAGLCYCKDVGMIFNIVVSPSTDSCVGM